MQLKAGELFDRHYRLIRELGNGGFSVVWLAEDLRVHSLKVALKIYASAQAKPGDVEVFINKFELVYNITHTNLLPPNACGEFNGMLYLVLRYCERGSSSSLTGNISETGAWNFLYDVASGLECLHQKSIIHQDIKPDNVLITNDGRYIITDFDISAQAHTTRRLTADAPAGTSAYMSPERFGANTTPIKAGDIWALGASLSELISANLPFGDLGGLNQKNGAEVQRIKNPVSRDLKKIIALCLQIEPWNRPTAGEIKMWCGMHFKKGKIRFDKKYTAILHPAKKVWEKILWISGIAAAAAISGIVVMNQKGNTKVTEIKAGETEPIPVVVDTVRFNRFKANATKNFDFAQKMGDSDYYEDALIYCDSALSIISNDMEMIVLKEKIKTRIK